MPLTTQNIEDGVGLATRVDAKYRPVWEGRMPEEAAALALYFLPHRSAKSVLLPTRPRLIKWYCPFADQRAFASGHRYCLNVFTGCSHGCEYCYAVAYSPGTPCVKEGFASALRRDLDELDAYEVPAAPLHLSNSTDPFQPLELKTGQTRVALERVLLHRRSFTTVVILTKNPGLAAKPEYLQILQRLNELPLSHSHHDPFARQGMPGCRVEVSLAFWRDEARAVFDPGAPSVRNRLEAIRRLRDADIPVVLRVDPLLPRSPIAGKSMPDFGLPEAQSLGDLNRLLAFAVEVGVMHVVHSPAKIVRPRGRALSPAMRDLKRVYERVAPLHKLAFHGGSWRMPADFCDQEVVGPFRELCRRHGLTPRCCKENLITTP